MKKLFKGYGGLGYITVIAPVRKVDGEQILDVHIVVIERAIAKAIIENRIPIRGQELRLLKSVLELSFESLSKDLEIAKQTLVNWVKAKDKRLSAPYEMAIRILVAEKLGIKLKLKFSDLRASDKIKKIRVEAA